MKLWHKVIIIPLVLFNLYFALFYNRFWSNGDEVHYLTVTSSLIQDKDFNLTNNYANKDYFSHHPVEEPPHAIVDKASQLRPFHSVLLSILTIPGYHALNLSGARINMLVLHFFGLWLIWILLKKQGFGDNVSTGVLALYLTACPVLIYSTVIFPDLLQGYLVASVLLLLNYSRTEVKNQQIYLIAASALSGLGVFLHLKLLLLTGLILLTWILIEISKNFDYAKLKTYLLKTAYIFTPYFIFLLLLGIINYRWYGSFSLSGPVVGAETEKMFRIWPFQGFFGQLIDIESGMLWWAPGLAIWGTGFYTWFKKDRISFLTTTIPIIIFTLLVSTFVDWKAGYSPAGRYVIYLLPILIISAAHTVQSLFKHWAGKIVYALAIALNCILTYPLFFSISFGYPFYQNTNWHWQFYYNMTPLGNRIQNMLYFFNFGQFNWKRILLVVVVLIALAGANYLICRFDKFSKDVEIKTKTLES